jgi:hypothetical protein
MRRRARVSTTQLSPTFFTRCYPLVAPCSLSLDVLQENSVAPAWYHGTHIYGAVRAFALRTQCTYGTVDEAGPVASRASNSLQREKSAGLPDYEKLTSMFRSGGHEKLANPGTPSSFFLPKSRDDDWGVLLPTVELTR